MTIPTLTVASLKKAKNAVIGNPLAKVQLVKDQHFVSTLIDCLNPPTSEVPLSAQDKAAQDALRIEAAHVVASLSYGSEEALGVLLRANAHHAFLYAFSHFTHTDPPALRAAFSRALRALAASIADVVGPSIWGLRPDKSLIRTEAQQALAYLFQAESLDIYLPLLVLPGSSSSSLTSPSIATSRAPPSSTNIATSIAQMLSTTIRSKAHRAAVTNWLPLSERQREVTTKSKRGWEKTAALSSNLAAGPWVARRLLDLLGDSSRERESKLVEAVLSALASLARENSIVSEFLGKSTPDKEFPPYLANILGFTKSRSVDVQLAACLCVTHIIRACLPTLPPILHISPSSHSSMATLAAAAGHVTSPTASSSTHASASSSSHTPTPSHGHSHTQSHRDSIAAAQLALEENCTRTVMNIVNRLLAAPLPTSGGGNGVSEGTGIVAASMTSGAESYQAKTRACYILHYLVADDAALCHAAFDRGCLEHLATLIRAINPKQADPVEWEEGEPESLSRLREAALTTLATLALLSDDIRRRITDELSLLPCISRALRAKRHVGTRYAACQCVRAVSRAVSVLRTSIVDSGLGMDVLRIVMGQELGPGFGVGGGGSLTIGKGKESANERAEDAMVVDSAGNGKQKDLGEDRRVLGAALAAVCNIVNDFSPLRPIYLEEKLMPRLVYILRGSDDPPLRLNALWAVKNLVRKTSTETKRDIMSCVGWSELGNYLSDPDEDIQEQAFNALRNLTENEEGINLVLSSLDPPLLLSKVLAGLQSRSEDVVLQACFALANLANGSEEQQEEIMRFPGMLSALRVCIAEGGPGLPPLPPVLSWSNSGVVGSTGGAVNSSDVRRPAVGCILTLVQGQPRRRKEMTDAGIVSTLKRFTEWSGHGPSLGGSGHGHAGGISLSPPNTSSVRWGGRTQSPVRGSAASGTASAGVYGSWAGTGSMHQHHSQHHQPWYQSSSSSGRGSAWPSHMALEDDRDVVQRARQALEWLEHGETYIT
ncbi:armadillo-type protein [Gymnopilus junonius]|uniref:Armadillo-type protein n=1 Tax=Gymnopilus junonius TaxID=109634 RepID=A0A9P5NR16_GYMJU|nr:armadillo-type protein [Gymnopilus junonius]